MAVPDLDIWTLYHRGASGAPVYILGSPAVDRFILIPGAAIKAVKPAVVLFDGMHSLDTIKRIMERQHKCAIDINHLYARLSVNGLIASPKPAYVEAGDIDSMSLKLVDVDIRPVFRIIEGFAVTAAPALAMLSFLLIVVGSILELMDHSSSSQGALHMAIHHQSLHRDIALYYILLFSSFIFHEFSHGLAATYFGLIPRKLCFGMYLGYLPMIYLRIGGTYTLAERKRVVVWLAGPWFNLTFASLCVLVLHLVVLPVATGHVVFVAAVANYWIAIVNLLPFLPTDGYFILVTLMKRINIRANAWRDLIRWIKREPSQFTTVTAAYLFVTIGCSIFMIARVIRSVHSALDLRLWLTVIPICALIMRTVYRQRMRRSSPLSMRQS